MKELTKAEEQVMKAIWSAKGGFVKDIYEEIPAPKPAYNTVLTVIRILVQKEFLTYKAYGKSFEYHPVLSIEAYSNQQLKSLKKGYFDNSTKKLLSFFVRENNISLEELDELMNELKKQKDEK